MKPENPFLIQGYASPEYFCDRTTEATTMLDALKNGNNLTIIAPRKMGKTGLIRHVFHKLKDEHPDIVTLYMDIYATQDLGDFVKLFASTVLGQLDSAQMKALKRIGMFVKSCRPVITFDEIIGLPKVTIEISPKEEETTLKEIFEYLASSDRRCCIAIDEFQQIAKYPEKGVEALLRSHIQFINNVSFIFSGSAQHIMQEMFLSAKRPFYLSTQILTIGTIDREKYYDFASPFFKEQGRSLSKEIFNEIYDSFDGHTWYVQNVLNRLYRYQTQIDSKLVNYAINAIVDESEYLYQNILNQQTQIGIKLLKAIAKEKIVKKITAGDFISKYGLKAASSVNSTQKRLIKNELIYKTPSGFIIYDRFFSEWLSRIQS